VAVQVEEKVAPLEMIERAVGVAAEVRVCQKLSAPPIFLRPFLSLSDLAGPVAPVGQAQMEVMERLEEIPRLGHT